MKVDLKLRLTKETTEEE